MYDLLGRELEVLVNDARTAGVYTANFDASRFRQEGVRVYAPDRRSRPQHPQNDAG